MRQADTSIVDDLTTLLAYLQLHAPLLQSDSLGGADGDSLDPFLLTPGRDRIAFMLGLAVSADLLDVQGGRAIPKRAEARRWLSASRPIRCGRWRRRGATRPPTSICGTCRGCIPNPKPGR